MSLAGTVALVTGAGSGLGAAAARHLLRAGARVVLADLREPPSDVSGAASTAASAVVCRTDVTQEESVAAALDAAEQAFGEPVNAAVNCAGVAAARRTLSSRGPHPLSEFGTALQVNLLGSFNVARLAAERMARRPPDADGLRGCLLHTASIAAFEGQAGQVAYAASKGGVVGMTLPMARDLAPLGIRVVTIAPGLFETPLLDKLPPDVKRELGQSVPCPSRLGRPEEFARLVGTVLTSPYLNGSVIRLDGALRMPP